MAGEDLPLHILGLGPPEVRVDVRIQAKTHTQGPFGDYCDPRLWPMLATDLHVQVVPSNTAGLRCAFIPDWGNGRQAARAQNSPACSAANCWSASLPTAASE